MDADHVSVRRAILADAETVLNLITQLAHYEKLDPPDESARARLLEDGWGDSPRFEAWLAEIDGIPVGYAIVFETYSTFLARPTLYLEDIFVLPAFRRRGIGQALLRHTIQLAHERGCGRMEWTCLDWNTKAQAAYERLGARCMREWLLYRLTREAIDEIQKTHG